MEKMNKDNYEGFLKLVKKDLKKNNIRNLADYMARYSEAEKKPLAPGRECKMVGGFQNLLCSLLHDYWEALDTILVSAPILNKLGECIGIHIEIGYAYEYRDGWMKNWSDWQGDFLVADLF